MTTPSPHEHNTSGSSFRQRLGYYLVGVAIGLVALGFLWSNRQRAVQNQQSQQGQITGEGTASGGESP